MITIILTIVIIGLLQYYCRSSDIIIRRSSKGEQIVESFLRNHNISYITLFKIPIPKRINPSGKAYIDYFIPKYNLFIEYNGRLHYEYTPYFHKAESDFSRQVRRDKYVRNYCKINGIKLLEIRYDQHIINTLKNYFMDIVESPPYAQMQRTYSNYFSLGYLNTDITTKFALISLTCHLTYKLKQKRPDITHYQVLKKIMNEDLPEDFIKGVAVVCSDFAYGCKSFPTFGLEDKQIPAKIKEILNSYMPFLK